MKLLVDYTPNKDLIAAIVDSNNRLQHIEIDPNLPVIADAIYSGKITQFIKNQDLYFVDLGNAQSGVLNAPQGRYDIGQSLLVQIKQPPVSGTENKNALLSTDLRLQGQATYLTPNDPKIKTSRRLPKEISTNIKDYFKKKDLPIGFIARSSLEAVKNQKQIISMIEQDIQEFSPAIKTLSTGKYGLIWTPPHAPQRAFMDWHTNKITQIIAPDKKTEKTIQAWLHPRIPTLSKQIKIDTNIFDHCDLWPQIDALTTTTVQRDSIEIIIEETAALTSIDINIKGPLSPFDAARMAIETISQQIRLRNINGMIVIDLPRLKDFIDQKKILSFLRKSIDQDPCRVDIYGFTKMGLLEITRQRHGLPIKILLNS